MKKTYNPVIRQVAQISTPFNAEGGVTTTWIISMPDFGQEDITIYGAFGADGNYIEKNDSLATLLSYHLSSESTIDWFDTDVIDEFIDSEDAENCYQSILIALLKYRCKH